MDHDKTSRAFHAFVAAIIGAIGTDAYLSISKHVPPWDVWEFIASTAFGPQAFHSAVFVWVGLVMHLITALFWAYLYAFVFTRVSALQNWITGGIVLGIVVDVCMNGVLASRGALGPITPSSIVSGLITNVVFYGLLVAGYVSWSSRSERAHRIADAA